MATSAIQQVWWSQKTEKKLLITQDKTMGQRANVSSAGKLQ